MTFALDGGMSVYDVKKDDEVEEFKGIKGEDLVIQADRKRNRIKNYNENEVFRAIGPGGMGGKSSQPKLPKMPVIQEFQFCDISRITELFQKEADYETCVHQRKKRVEQAKRDNLSIEAITSIETSNPDDPKPLTEEELQERKSLLDGGFRDWLRRDFILYIKLCEKHGRTDIKAIISGMAQYKSSAQVKRYHAVFWNRYTEISDHERYLKRIEEGEGRILKLKEISKTVAWKYKKYGNPWRDMTIMYGSTKTKTFTEEEDRFILCMTYKLGYGCWEKLKAEIRVSPLFRFDWFFKSRYPTELHRRADTLIRLVEKELDASKGNKRAPDSKLSAASAKKQKV